jgi:hypothetical protein
VHDASVRQPGVLPPPARRYSILPAAIVLILAVLTLFSFAIVDLWASPTTTATTLPNVVNGALKVDTSTVAFSHWLVDGLPPSNIASALIVPVGAIRVGTVKTGGSGVDYDREIRLSVPAPRAVLLGFYRSNLEAIGWQLFSSGAAPGGGNELIFEKGGDNGESWNCGVIAQRTDAGRTSYVFRLFDVGDDE